MSCACAVLRAGRFLSRPISRAKLFNRTIVISHTRTHIPPAVLVCDSSSGQVHHCVQSRSREDVKTIAGSSVLLCPRAVPEQSNNVLVDVKFSIEQCCMYVIRVFTYLCGTVEINYFEMHGVHASHCECWNTHCYHIYPSFIRPRTFEKINKIPPKPRASCVVCRVRTYRASPVHRDRVGPGQ